MKKEGMLYDGPLRFSAVPLRQRYLVEVEDDDDEEERDCIILLLLCCSQQLVSY